MSTPTRLAAVALALATCTNDGGVDTGPVTADQAEAGCRRDCEHDKACDPTDTEPVEVCAARCASDIATWIRADAFGAIIDCMATLACGMNDDVCLEQCQPTATHAAYEVRCREVFAACSTELDRFCEVTPDAETQVGLFCLITPSIVTEMIACVPDGTTCETGLDCIEDVFTRHGIDF